MMAAAAPDAAAGRSGARPAAAAAKDLAIASTDGNANATPIASSRATRTASSDAATIASSDAATIASSHAATIASSHATPIASSDESTNAGTNASPGGRPAGQARRRGARNRGHAEPVPGTAADLTPQADPESVAREICLRQLTLGPRTRAQLEGVLAARGVPEAAAAAVLDRFVEVGLVDDARFADAWVASRHGGRGLARRALRAELESRGVAGPVVEVALEQVDDDAERAAATDLVRRRLPSLAGLPEPAQARRLAGLLARRGYPPGLARRVVEQAVAGVELEPPE